MFFLFFWQERDRDVWQKCWTVHQQLPRSSHRIQILAITVHCQINGASQTCLPCNIFNVTSITCPYWNLPYISKKINNGISIWYNLDNLSLSLVFFFFYLRRLSLIFDWAEWYPGKEICNKCCTYYLSVELMNTSQIFYGNLSCESLL